MVRAAGWAAALGFAVVAVVTCTETTTQPGQTTYTVAIEASSAVLDAGSGYQVGDVVQFNATVQANGRTIQVSDPVFESSEPQIIQVDPESGEAELLRTGSAAVSVGFNPDRFPDSLLSAELDIQVDSIYAEVSVTSPTIAAGHMLVEDMVQFSAVAKRKDGTEVSTQGRSFASSDGAVVEILDAFTGEAVFTGKGDATVTVSFTRPVVPGDGPEPTAEPLTASLPISVEDFAVLLSAASKSSGALPNDTLESDTVLFAAKVVQASDTLPVSGQTFTSSDDAVVEIVEPTTGEAVFTGPGPATVTVDFTDPQVPRMTGSLDLNVETYVVQVNGETAPVMGDTVDYTATVTRNGETVSDTSGASFSSSDESVMEVVNASTGRIFARDIGTADVEVTFAMPTLPHASVTGSASVDISQERFYGVPDVAQGAFGDAVRVQASEVHRFTDSTQVFFSDGTAAFVDSADADDQIRFLVGAGTALDDVITFRNLVDDLGGPRGPVVSRFMFDRADSIPDEFEPNDVLQNTLDPSVEITTDPFIELLSIDPSKAAPADTDFFYFEVGAGGATYDFLAEWAQTANIDFKVCAASGDPPDNYNSFDNGDAVCVFETTGTTTGEESQENVSLSAGVRFVLLFYCRAPDCPTVPLTYRVTVDQQ